jgi:hypothetical protein
MIDAMLNIGLCRVQCVSTRSELQIMRGLSTVVCLCVIPFMGRFLHCERSGRNEFRAVGPLAFGKFLQPFNRLWCMKADSFSPFH